MRSCRTVHQLLTAAIAGPLLAVAVAAPAAADDAGVFNAYVARQSTDLKAANSAWHDAFRVVKRSKADRGVRGVIRANKQINAVLTTIESELAAQAPSSEIGARAHRNAIREVRGWRRANRYENRAWRRVIAGRSSRRQFERSTDEFLRAFRQGQRAIRRFAKLGLSSPERAITQSPERR